MKSIDVEERAVSQLFYIAQATANSLPILFLPHYSGNEESVISQPVIAGILSYKYR